MLSNVEIKARVRDLVSFETAARKLSNDQGTILHQFDTFFLCANGRLKLRCINGSAAGQLIFYNRADESGPKTSQYWLSHVEDASSLRETLTHAYGIRGEVKKKRTLFMVGQTRIHVDEVENLGTFMELEVVMQQGQTEKCGQQIAEDLMTKLGVQDSDLIRGSYIDLI